MEEEKDLKGLYKSLVIDEIFEAFIEPFALI